MTNKRKVPRISMQPLFFRGILAFKADNPTLSHFQRNASVEFQSVDPSAAKSIRQRELLNPWLRLYAKQNRKPCFADYQPERLADEIQDLVYYTVETAQQMPRFTHLVR